MSRVSFTWSKSSEDRDHLVMVRCHIDGTDYTTTFGPMPAKIADSFIHAKRDMLDRRVRTIAQAIRILEPQGKLLQ